MIFEYFLQIQPFGFHGNESNSEDWTKMICLVEDYSRNISVKFCQNIRSEVAKKAYFHFSYYKSMKNFKLP